MLAAVAASLSAAAAAAVGVVGVVENVASTPLELVLQLHGEQLVGDCWLLYTLCQRKAKTVPRMIDIA